MDSKITRLIEQASVIVGALPYLQAYRDKTFLIKFGGSAMDDARLVKKLMRDIVLLEVLGFNPVIVHGGGKAISKAMAEAGLEARFVNGLRVTTPEAISIVERTLSGTINPGLVQMFRNYGGKGVGIPSNLTRVGEVISIRENSRQSAKIKAVVEENSARPCPKWLEVNRENLEGKIVAVPAREDIDLEVDETLIVELYSK